MYGGQQRENVEGKAGDKRIESMLSLNLHPTVDLHRSRGTLSRHTLYYGGVVVLSITEKIGDISEFLTLSMSQ
jgi:hypothetical protein